MKRILVPTDLSDLGDHAYGIASILAKATEAEIMVLTIVEGPAGAMYSESGELMNDEGEDYTEWQRKLEESNEKLQQWKSDKPAITKSISCIGNINDTLLRISESQEIDLIVMGTEGQFGHAFWSKSSHTKYITNHSDIPVLSLKCNRADLDLKEIVLVSDFLNTEKINLNVLKDIQSAFQSTLVLLKVNLPAQVRSDDQIYADMELFAENNDLKNFVLKTYKDDSVELGIGKFTAENDIDLISLGTHQGHGFSKLFRRSVSDDVVNHLFHPVLTFPL